MEEMDEARRNTRKMQHQRGMTRMMLPMHLAEEMILGMMNLGRKKNKNARQRT
jgi:hypothetical protein